MSRLETFAGFLPGKFWRHTRENAEWMAVNSNFCLQANG
jgi:hypothetical protein